MCRIYHTLGRQLKKKGHSTAVGDEGGFAPNLASDEESHRRNSERGGNCRIQRKSEAGAGRGRQRMGRKWGIPAPEARNAVFLR